MGRYALIIVTTLVLLMGYYMIASNRTRETGLHQTIEANEYNHSRNVANSAVQLGVMNFINGNWEIADGETRYLDANDNWTVKGENDPLAFHHWSQINGYYALLAQRNGSEIVLTATGRKHPNSEREREVKALFTVEEGEEEGDGVPLPTFDGIFSSGGIEFNSSAKVYGNIGTNSTAMDSVAFKNWGAEVHGDVFIGPGGNPNNVLSLTGRGMGHIVGGGVENLEEKQSFALPPFPDFPPAPDDLPWRGNFTTPWIASGYYPIDECGEYNAITASSGRKITINVGSGIRTIRTQNLNLANGSLDIEGSGILRLFVTNNLTLGGNRDIDYKNSGRNQIVVTNLNITQGHIKLNNSEMTLYVSNNLTYTGSSSLNANGDISQLMIYYAGSTKPSVGGNTPVVGSLYIKNADFDIPGSSGVTGHIVSGGGTITISGNAEANVRMLYAPNSTVRLTGSGRIKGNAVANKLMLDGGGSTVTFDGGWSDDFELPGFGDPGSEATTSIIYRLTY